MAEGFVCHEVGHQRDRSRIAPTNENGRTVPERPTSPFTNRNNYRLLVVVDRLIVTRPIRLVAV